MMKIVLFSWLIVTVCAMMAGFAAFGEGVPRVAFVRDMEIWLTDLAGSPPVYLVDGFDPAISPDGSLLAFTYYREGRKIAVFDIDAGALQVIEAIPGDNNYGPRWSRDGKWLVFNYWKEMDSVHPYWVIAVIQPDGSDFRLLTEDYREGLYSPFWAHDGLSVYAQDLESLYQFDLDGQLLSTQDIKQIVEIGISSATSFSFSADGQHLLYDRLVDDTMDLWATPWMHEPASAVFIYHTEDGIAERVSPSGTSFINPVWVPGEDGVLVYGFTETDLPDNTDSEIPFRIFQLKIEDQSFTVLVENGMFPTCAMK